jgi:lia operon protein LiaG
MKTIITGLLLLFAVTTQAQKEYTMAVKGNATETWVNINNLFADLIIEGTTGSEIKIVASDYEGLPEKAKGLKPLSASGPENTGIGLSIKQEGNTISISGAHREADEAEYKILLPKNLRLKLDYNSWQAGDVVIKGMAGEVEAKSQVGDLKFIDVTGPIVAHTLSSDLEVTFTSIAQTSPSSLTSTSGDIDVTMPSSVKGTFKMSTISGGIYTGFEFDFGEETSLRRAGGQSATGKLNGGGVEVSLRSISGDVFIRKAN